MALAVKRGKSATAAKFEPSLIVITGLDPVIQGKPGQKLVELDCRVKPGNDEKGGGQCVGLRHYPFSSGRKQRIFWPRFKNKEGRRN
jgi:hypothetical protein